MIRSEPPLYRQEALEHHLRSHEPSRVADVSSHGSWASLIVVSAIVLAAIVASFVLEAEVTGRARGLFRPEGGVYVLTTEVNGRVADVLVRSGAHVAADAPLVRLNSAELQAQLIDAQNNLRLVEADYLDYTRRQAQALDAERALLDVQLQTLTGQATSYTESVLVFERKLTATHRLHDDGLVGTLAVDDAEEAVAQVRRQQAGVRLQLEQMRRQLFVLESRRRELTWQARREVELASNRVAATRQALHQTTIRAPREGVVEGIAVKPGDIVDRGHVIGELIPGTAGLQVAAFLPEQDRAFVNVGDAVYLEIDQLPYLEFGTVEGRVTRIGAALASPREVAESTGNGFVPTTPTYRIDVEMRRGAVEDLGHPVRSGMLVNVRYTLRKQRLITLVLSPLRKWLS